MEISATLLRFKLHILISLAISLLVISLVYISPRFLDVFAYFWPLFLSTALFLVAVVLFGHTSPPATEAHGEKAAEGILSFVAGQPEELVEPVLGGSTSDHM